MGTIKTVTQENLQEFVAGRKQGPEPTAARVDVGTTAAPGVSGVVGAGVETISTAPPPSVPNASAQPPEKHKDRNPVQERIDQLVREKKEFEEFAQGEYEARMQLQERVRELEGRQPAVKAAEPAPKPVEAPVPADDPEPVYAEGDTDFLEKWGKWNRRQALRDFEGKAREEREKAEVERLVKEANERREASLKAARAEYMDFDEVIRQAGRDVDLKKIPAPPRHVEQLLWDSDYQAQLLYHFAKNPQDAERIFALRPAAAALALGRLETKFEKQSAPAPAAAEPTKPNISKAPAPMPSLNGAADTALNTDLSQPMKFSDYKVKRLEEIRKARRH